MLRLLRVLAVVVVLAAVVVGSYQLGYTRGTSDHTAYASAPAAPPEPAAPATPPGDASTRFEVFWEVWNLVESQFYNKDAIDHQKMTYAAIRGMLGTLGDAHTVFADPSHARMSEEDMRGTFDGIGVSVEMRDNALTIVAPLDESPGQRAGLRAGDIIMAVDGKDTTDLTINAAVALIRGPRGTKVMLTIVREGGPAPFDVEIERAEIKTVTVRGEMKEGGVGYVRVTQFSEPTAKLVQQKLKELTDGKAKAIVLDLRNNPGGLLSSAVEIASQFVGDGVILYEQRRDAEQQAITARRGGLATDIPIVVLVNKGSASASEIVAGAIKDRGRGVLVGEQTFGKDTVQTVHQLSDQSSVRVTIARWFTPNSQDMGGKGLEPDIVVPFTEEDLKAGQDPQLERALEQARTGR